MTAPLHLHHVGIVVRDIAGAGHDYVERLGYAARTEVIHDPVQTAFVQFFGLGDTPPYVELVAPDGAASKLSAALAKGGGLNHLCYATDDVTGSCDDLRARGLTVIQPPVPAVAFAGRRIAWLAGSDRVLIELVERGGAGDL